MSTNRYIDKLKAQLAKEIDKRMQFQALFENQVAGNRALLAERDRMAKALKKIDDAYCNSSPTATDFGISWDRGMLIGTMKDIARAALQGEQP